jgi:hypothetical protein
MSTGARDRPAVELAKSVAWTVQLGLFLALAVGPLVAGFLAPLGAPQHAAEVVDVSAAADAPEGAVAYGNLSADSRAAFDALLDAPDDRVVRRTDAPPALLEPGEHTVVRGDLAVRVTATESQPLRPVAILGGVLGGVAGTILGGAVLSRDPVP